MVTSCFSISCYTNAPSPWVWRRSGQRLKAAGFGWRDDGREVSKVCGKREMKSRFLKKSGKEEEIHQTRIQVGYPPPAAHGPVRNRNPNNPQPMCTHHARALKTCTHRQTARTLAPRRAWCVSTPSAHRARSAWLGSMIQIRIRSYIWTSFPVFWTLPELILIWGKSFFLVLN